MATLPGTKSNSLISSTSGRVRWMISATVAAWALFGVDRSVTSWPAAARLSEALKVWNRTVWLWPCPP